MSRFERQVYKKYMPEKTLAQNFSPIMKKID